MLSQATREAKATLPVPKGVIFDWDNTLVNTWPIIHDALNHTFAAMRMAPWTMEQTKARVRRSMRDSFPDLFGPDWQKAGEMYQQHYRATHLARLEALPGAHDVLEAVRALGLYNVVVSNKKAGSLRKEVEHIGWSGLFDRVVGSDDAARDKPHCEPVQFALEGSGLAAGPDIWFIGDSEIDLECARNTGCTPLLFGELIADGHVADRLHYQGFPYRMHLKDHADTLRLLKSLG